MELVHNTNKKERDDVTHQIILRYNAYSFLWRGIVGHCRFWMRGKRREREREGERRKEREREGGRRRKGGREKEREEEREGER